MTKKKYVPLKKRNREYRLYLDDIKKVHKLISKPRPPLPPFDHEEKSVQLD